MNRKRILIVDDESSLLESLEMFLSEKGYDVCCALSALEGLAKSASFDPHVIILDVRLPDMDGIEVLRRLRAGDKTNVIIITAFHDMDTTIRAVKSGAFEYIPKPIDVEELEKAIESGAAACPYCGSSNTRQTNSFGCTPCRAIAYCSDCRQPFEQLKPL